MATAASACSSCGKPISGSEILYTEDAQMVCAACSDVSSMKSDERRAAGNIQKAAWTCLATSLAGWFFNPFFIMNISTMIAGVWCIQSMARGNERFTNYLSAGGRAQIWICSILGIVITAIQILIIIFAVGVVATHVGHERY